MRRLALAAMMLTACAWGQDAKQNVVPDAKQNVIPDAKQETSSTFDKGLLLAGMTAEYHATADGRDAKQIRMAVDDALQNGTLTGPDALAYAPALITIYRMTLLPKYWKAVEAMHDSVVADLKDFRTYTPQESYAAATFLAAYAATTETDFDTAITALTPQYKPGETHSATVRADAAAWKIAATLEVVQWMPPSEERAKLLRVLQSDAANEAKSPTDGGLTIALRVRHYAFLKGIRLGYFPQSMKSATLKSAMAIHDAPVNAAGHDLAEGAAAMMLSSELQQAETEGMAQGKVVAVDAWFNSQHRKEPANANALFHYKWSDDADSGFSFFGRAFQRYGASLTQMTEEPTEARLNDVSVYVIASPDIPIKNPKPNYVTTQDVDAITKWVGQGGTLLLLQNDGPNAEFEHFNTLSERFGIHFNAVLRNTVEGTKYEQGKVVITGNTGVFEQPHTAYMKEICTLSVLPPAQVRLTDQLHDSGEVYMAVAKYGKGTVLALVDPWLYNEYIDNRKLPMEYDQFAGAKDLAKWVLLQSANAKTH